MPQQTIDLFNGSLMKTTEMFKELETYLGISERRRSYHIFRVVLHAIRDRLPVNEAADLAAQLPLILKGVFYDGWVPAHMPEKMRKDEFLARISSEINLGSSFSAEDVLQIVIAVLKNHISEGEFDDIKAIWPKELREIID